MKPKENLIDLTEEEYKKTKASGMFWVWYPEATGSYSRDVIQKVSDLSEDGYNEYLLRTSQARPTLQQHVHIGSEEQKHSHYFKEWHGKIDVYRVCDLFEVNDAAISHAVKKLLCTGNRGHKDFRKDIEDVIDTLNRKLGMMDEDGSLK